MNPSASGWIDKYGSLIEKEAQAFPGFDAFYRDLKKTGFVYGLNVAIPSFLVPEHSLSEDEKAKINLVHALFGTFFLETGVPDFGTFLDSIFAFYRALDVGRISFLHKILMGKKTSVQLEKLLDSRIYLADNVISRTFNRSITNSLLFIDILLFRKFLGGFMDIRQHGELLEYLSVNITYHALNSKETQKSDKRLANLFSASLSFIDETSFTFDGAYRKQLWEKRNDFENRYLLDIACLTVWEDHSLDYRESEFIFGLGKDLGFNDAFISLALNDIRDFFAENLKQISFLVDTNPAVHFYDSMAKVVDKLISRNSKRLQKELLESRELVSLLSQSTLRDLGPEEKSKVRSQLMDIFKSIPSLAIFLLPGGAVLLPIFIKLIPKLLPSSFDENRVEK